MILYSKTGRSEAWTHVSKIEIGTDGQIRFTSGEGWRDLNPDGFDTLYLLGDDGFALRAFRDKSAVERAEKLAQAQDRKEKRRTRRML